MIGMSRCGSKRIEPKDFAIVIMREIAIKRIKEEDEKRRGRRKRGKEGKVKRDKWDGKMWRLRNSEVKDLATVIITIEIEIAITRKR